MTKADTRPEDDVVFITIYREDRAWINETKTKTQNRENRLHQVLENYRNAVKSGAIKDE